MTANESFQLLNERGWRRGLGNLLRAELGGWWKTSSWWVQILIWVSVVNISIASVIWGTADDAPEGLSLIVAYIQISVAGGVWLNPLNFLAGMGIIWLYQLFFLTLTLMLGVLSEQRAAAIGIPLALAFGTQLLLGVVPALQYLLPWRLAVGVENGMKSVIESVILGMKPFSWLPVVAVAGCVLLFTAVAIYRFRQEEF
ncbi:hypothetical protein [Candidatus Leptofilum sp.]|uniref:hypothetical protein n=1 Tax=Candidatus Leptofilum sp. TaxID=3241576 RepID=UPI003B58C0AA